MHVSSPHAVIGIIILALVAVQVAGGMLRPRHHHAPPLPSSIVLVGGNGIPTDESGFKPAPVATDVSANAAADPKHLQHGESGTVGGPPSVYTPVAPPSRVRVLWEAFHHALGRTLLLTAAVNVLLGIKQIRSHGATLRQVNAGMAAWIVYCVGGVSG